MSVEKPISNEEKITIMINTNIKKTDIQSFISCLARQTQAMLEALIYLNYYFTLVLVQRLKN